MRDSEQFFYDHAGYAYPQDSSPEQIEAARRKAARDLATAEERVKAGPYFVENELDSEPWDGDVEWDGPVWIVTLYSVEGSTKSQILGSLSGVGAQNDDPYLRVVAAELALEYLPTVEV